MRRHGGKRLAGWLALFTLASGTALGAASDARLVHAVLVVVNGQRISRENLDDAAVVLLKRKYPNQSQVELTAEEIDALSTEALRELVRVWLITDEARQQEIRLAVSEVDEEMRQAGVDPLDASAMQRKFFEAELLFDRILHQAGYPRYKPSPGQIKRFYRENLDVFTSHRFVRVRQIFIDTAIEKEQKARLLLETIRTKMEELPAGERETLFAEAAKEYSHGRFADAGGLIRLSPDPEGWFPQEFPNQDKEGKPIFPEAMVQAVRGLTRPGDLSRVVRSPLGYHLLFLAAVRGGKTLPFGDTRTQTLIARHLARKERDRRLRDWLRKKWARSQIFWHDGERYSLEELLPDPTDGAQARTLGQRRGRR